MKQTCYLHIFILIFCNSNRCYNMKTVHLLALSLLLVLVYTGNNVGAICIYNQTVNACSGTCDGSNEYCGFHDMGDHWMCMCMNAHHG
ncbi:hypothetical protein ACJMK2_025854 [Sinanodonta woodiana]|uniref:Uncharacterized protein n=1 Tax=Sinanodonta woodiana TaxID=1069815 RepID=A0ABD3XLD5_SINWO